MPRLDGRALRPRPTPRRKAALPLLTCLLSLLAAPVAAQSAPAPQPEPELQLQSVEERLRQERLRQERLSQEADTLSSELDGVRNELVTTARAAQEHEETLTTLETRLATLTAEEDRLKETLSHRDEQTVRVLTALQRLAWRPSEALIAQPLTPNEAVRAAILLRTAVPQIKASVAQLSEQMRTLSVLKGQISAQRDRIAVVARELTDQRTKLETLASRKGGLQRNLLAQSKEAETRAARLAIEAADLRDLLVMLAEEKKRREEEERLRAQAQKAEKAAQMAALPAPTGFSKARGKLPMPARGRITRQYGEVNDVGLASKGILIETRAGAQVTTPYEGVVVFSGPFRRYGQLLILEHGEGYHVLLAGMEIIDATVGQHLLAGEPVGTMSGRGKPELYVEIRRNGQPINPVPWMVTQKDNESG